MVHSETWTKLVCACGFVFTNHRTSHVVIIVAGLMKIVILENFSPWSVTNSYHGDPKCSWIFSSEFTWDHILKSHSTCGILVFWPSAHEHFIRFILATHSMSDSKHFLFIFFFFIAKYYRALLSTPTTRSLRCWRLFSLLLDSGCFTSLCLCLYWDYSSSNRLLY